MPDRVILASTLIHEFDNVGFTYKSDQTGSVCISMDKGEIGIAPQDNEGNPDGEWKVLKTDSPEYNTFVETWYDPSIDYVSEDLWLKPWNDFIDGELKKYDYRMLQKENDISIDVYFLGHFALSFPMGKLQNENDINNAIAEIISDGLSGSHDKYGFVTFNQDPEQEEIDPDGLLKGVAEDQMNMELHTVLDSVAEDIVKSING